MTATEQITEFIRENKDRILKNMEFNNPLFAILKNKGKKNERNNRR